LTAGIIPPEDITVNDNVIVSVIPRTLSSV
jgi:hypothetical protein